MARKWSNQNLPGALHFVTGNLLNRTPLFTEDEVCGAFLKVCKKLQDEWPAKFIAYVLMPDHFHLIINPRDGNIRGFGGALKSLAAREILNICGGDLFLRDSSDDQSAIHEVWQESFKAQPLWSSWMIWQKFITSTETQ